MYDEEATLKLRQMQKDRQWFNENSKQLKKQFNEMYVAIKDEKIVASNKNLDALVGYITRTYPQNHRSVIIEEITDKRPICIL